MKAIVMPTLNDPDYCRFAWRRYRRLLGWMTMVAAVSAMIALIVLYLAEGGLPLHFGIAVTLAVFFTVLLTAALMGLVFLSSGTGHDETVVEPLDRDQA